VEHDLVTHVDDDQKAAEPYDPAVLVLATTVVTIEVQSAAALQSLHQGKKERMHQHGAHRICSLIARPVPLRQGKDKSNVEVANMNAEEVQSKRCDEEELTAMS